MRFNINAFGDIIITKTQIDGDKETSLQKNTITGKWVDIHNIYIDFIDKYLKDTQYHNRKNSISYRKSFSSTRRALQNNIYII